MNTNFSKKAIKTHDLRNEFSTINSQILESFDIHSDHDTSKQPSEIINESNGILWIIIIYIGDESSEKDRGSTMSSNSQQRNTKK